ncbi:rhotekin-like isoform X2 [Cimex lectularius]|uniref:REM-1 domain-containing protein n=1 Tax=Cimex lectularius TaxID=79782 RepID=A0A8I6RDJ1_CIMLE|nr:rhotekin-like isoform X2 [Cimex lectularius]
MNSCFPPLAALSLHGQPPKSQPERIEILQDLDLYYIKQIAHNLKELDLEQKIEVEIKMREGTTKLLAACKHQTQSLEAAKSLLTSNERMSAYMAELQRRKRQQIPKPAGCKARVCLSDLRMPLIWRDTDHFKNKGDYRRFAVFCLAKIGTEMYDTSLLCPVDRSLTDLTFSDVLVFNQVPSDFTFTLEVYSHMLRDDMSIASTRRKIKNTIHTSISRTVGKKLAASLRDELNSGKIGPHFELMASARLVLDDVNDVIRTHDLKLEHTDVRGGDALPLFGHFCCRLAAQPECMTRDVISSSHTNGYVSLQAFNLNFWKDRQHWLQGNLPLFRTPVNKETLIKCTKHGNDIIIVNEIEGKEETKTIKLNSKEDKEMWLEYLAAHIKDHERWKIAAEKVMDIYTPGTGKNNFQRTYRQGSLYDETPLIDTNESSDYRPTVHDIFGLTPSTSLSSCSSSSSPTFRERSLSSGGSNKSRTRSHWPFSRGNQD